MAELGYNNGTNFALEFVQIDSIGDYERGYRELVARKVDIMLATGPEQSLKSARAATQTLPMVMLAIEYDPIARGYVTSLARPTGNITGMFLQQIELAEKRVQILKDAFPDLRASIAFWDGTSTDQWDAAQTAATKLGFQLAGPYDYERALAQSAADHRGGLIVMVSPFFFRDRVRLAQFALRHRIVSMFGFREWVEAGGLLSYGPNIVELHRRIADYVDRIAKGAKPADLPIEQPTKFEFIINLKTARAIGVDMPTSLLLRADEVIE
jgi:putative tryptophan/tyrosine transport system substrate-binding protein